MSRPCPATRWHGLPCRLLKMMELAPPLGKVCWVKLLLLREFAFAVCHSVCQNDCVSVWQGCLSVDLSLIRPHRWTNANANVSIWENLDSRLASHGRYAQRCASSALEAKSSRLRLDMSQKSTLRVIWWQNGFGGSGRGIVELRYGGISLGPWQPSINEIFSSKLKEAWILRFPEILIGYRCAPPWRKIWNTKCSSWVWTYSTLTYHQNWPKWTKSTSHQVS